MANTKGQSLTTAEAADRRVLGNFTNEELLSEVARRCAPERIAIERLELELSAAMRTVDSLSASLTVAQTKLRERALRLNATDYRKLLLKMMNHFGACEGTCYLGSGWRDYSLKFTDEEWAELQKMEKEPIESS